MQQALHFSNSEKESGDKKFLSSLLSWTSETPFVARFSFGLFLLINNNFILEKNLIDVNGILKL